MTDNDLIVLAMDAHKTELSRKAAKARLNALMRGVTRAAKSFM